MVSEPVRLTLEQYIAKFPNPQAGPCTACGATGYGLSMGGPGICPACDCLPPERRVGQLAEENRQLRERIAELERLPAGQTGENGSEEGDRP
jgi:hypothetical protein